MKRIIFSIILFLFGAAALTAQDYGAIQNLALEFYAYQRAGILGEDPHNPFYTQSPFPHSGDSYQGADLSGGWYDAGDFVKFGLPGGFTAYCLLKGYDIFPTRYDDRYGISNTSAADGIPDILNQVKYQTDFLIKAVINSSTIILDVGNANQDHQDLNESGYANSQRTSGRPAYAADGADIAGMYGAALALMGKVYEPHDPAYAAQCVAKAREAFEFGLKNPKMSVQQTRDGQTAFYSSRGWTDKMGLAAVELYRATGEAAYLQWAQEFQQQTASHFFVLGYSHVGDLLAYEMYRQGFESTSKWMADINVLMNHVVTDPQASPLIQGVYIGSDWGNAGHAGNAAFSMALAFMVTGNDAYRQFVFDHVEWVAGINPFPQCYIMGYPGGPTQPHHRNDAAIGGLKGAVLSGPAPNGAFDPAHPENSTWTFSDNRATYTSSEPALNYNAGLIGALAFIRDYNDPPPGLIRISEPLRAAADPVDLNMQDQTLTLKFETSQTWTILLSGETSGAQKALTGSGSSISAQWQGEADQGEFMPGEKVTARLVSDNVAPYHIGLSRTSFFLLNTVRQAFRPADVLLSDFNTSGLANTAGGTWEAFADGSESYVSPAVLSDLNAITAKGEGGTKGLVVRLVGKPGALHPHAGIRTTFTADGGPISLGGITSIIFDINAAGAGALRVELEQPGINDGAYYGKDFTTAAGQWMRVRIPMDAMAQPEWKTAPATLSRDNLTALRVTYYGVENASFTLDNVHIENMDIGAPVVPRQTGFQGLMIDAGIRADGISYRFLYPRAEQYTWIAQLTDAAGKRWFDGRPEVSQGPGEFFIKTPSLPGGMYVLSHRSADGMQGSRRMIVKN